MSNHQILNSGDHAGLRVHVDAGADYGDAVMACLTVPAEFRQIQAHFPIVFRRDIATGRMSALALFGFEDGENLFLAGDRWDVGYRPLALSIQPFLIGRPASEGAEPQVHVDMDHPRVSSSGEGTLVFDEEGKPTPHLEKVAALLGDLDHAHREGEDFFAALERHALIEPFTVEVPLGDGSKHSLVGFQTVNEEKLATLDGDALRDLLAAGHLGPLYMALASLSQFSKLVDRKNAKVMDG